VTTAGPRVPGLQAERTRLAWRRTALGCFANTALVALHLPRSAVPALSWAALVTATATGVLVLAWARRREVDLTTGHRPAAPRRLIFLGVMVTVLCVLVGLDVLTSD
jgi:uncharacterized membrane protein YidH (DUF202 family)